VRLQRPQQLERLLRPRVIAERVAGVQDDVHAAAANVRGDGGEGAWVRVDVGNHGTAHATCSHSTGNWSNTLTRGS
jgi:hypothetical protein